MKAFARWRVKVWDRRLAAYRKAWNRAIDVADEHQHPEAYTARSVDETYEQLVTDALIRRTKWRKRAGVRKAGTQR